MATNERLAQLVDPAALEVSLRVSTAQYIRLLDNDDDLIRSPVTVTLDVFGTDLTTPGRLVREARQSGKALQGGLFAALMIPRPTPRRFCHRQHRRPPLQGVVQVPASAVDQVAVLG